MGRARPTGESLRTPEQAGVGWRGRGTQVEGELSLCGQVGGQECGEPTREGKGPQTLFPDHVAQAVGGTGRTRRSPSPPPHPCQPHHSPASRKVWASGPGLPSPLAPCLQLLPLLPPPQLWPPAVTGPWGLSCPLQPRSLARWGRGSPFFLLGPGCPCDLRPTSQPPCPAVGGPQRREPKPGRQEPPQGRPRRCPSLPAGAGWAGVWGL